MCWLPTPAGQLTPSQALPPGHSGLRQGPGRPQLPSGWSGEGAGTCTQLLLAPGVAPTRRAGAEHGPVLPLVQGLHRATPPLAD